MSGEVPRYVGQKKPGEITFGEHVIYFLTKLVDLRNKPKSKGEGVAVKKPESAIRRLL
ncbi:MAG: hypothetical protein M3Q44_04225 [bacterium]|nr:hypothetical protein [bacterium]